MLTQCLFVPVCVVMPVCVDVDLVCVGVIPVCVRVVPVCVQGGQAQPFPSQKGRQQDETCSDAAQMLRAAQTRRNALKAYYL